MAVFIPDLIPPPSQLPVQQLEWTLIITVFKLPQQVVAQLIQTLQFLRLISLPILLHNPLTVASVLEATLLLFVPTMAHQLLLPVNGR